MDVLPLLLVVVLVVVVVVVAVVGAVALLMMMLLLLLPLLLATFPSLFERCRRVRDRPAINRSAPQSRDQRTFTCLFSVYYTRVPGSQ